MIKLDLNSEVMVLGAIITLLYRITPQLDPSSTYSSLVKNHSENYSCAKFVNYSGKFDR